MCVIGLVGFVVVIGVVFVEFGEVVIGVELYCVVVGVDFEV